MSTPDVSGDWENELHSKMSLSLNGNEVTGEYFTAVGDDRVNNNPCKLKGTLHYPLISFMVNYSSVDSLCVWVGKFEEIKSDSGTSEIALRTLWLLGSLYSGAADNPQPTKFWNMFQTNQDTFKRPVSSTP